MKLNTTNGYLLIALSSVLLFGGSYILSDIPGSLADILNDSQGAKPPVVNKSLELMDKALQTEKHHEYFTYTGTFECPFRKKGSSSGKNTSKSQNIPERHKLYLKGILIKEKPLAILEDESGETYIRGVGEKVTDQVIVSILDTKVTLRDSRGSYELVVEEQ